jgi:putative phosphoesterase
MAGAMRLVITADTHVPKRAKDLPAALWSAIERADVVIHAGDWVDVALLDAIESRTRARLIGVFGNNDGPELRARLPEVAEADLDGLQIAVVHDSGPATGREERCSARYTGKNVLVFGHSHIPWDTTAPSGLRLLNPGSPTDRRRQPHATFVTAIVSRGALTRVELHRFGGRDPG